MNASQTGGIAPPSTRTLRDLYQAEYKPMRLVGRSKRTDQLYNYTIRQFGIYLGSEPTLLDLNDLTIANYLQHLIDQKRARASVNKERRQLLALWNFAARRRYVQQFPEVRPVPEGERIPKAWSGEELQRIAVACRMVGQFVSPNGYGGVPAGDWWLALHSVLWDTGERITAILRLHWTDLSGEWLTIPAENRKGAKRSLLCKLRPETVQQLAIIRRQHPEIFRWEFSGSYIYAIYAKILKSAGVESDRYSKFHRMRRSVASHLTAAGANATAALGHANAATTQRYIDPRIAKPVQVSEVLPNFLSEQES
jgi:integrase